MEVFIGFSPEAETAARANADRLESPPVPANAAEEGGPGTGTGAGAGGWSSSVGGQKRQRVSDAASTCTLWCAVAMGALVQGQPPERVRLREFACSLLVLNRSAVRAVHRLLP